jgi:flagellar hook-basal body complex protein FliE
MDIEQIRSLRTQWQPALTEVSQGSDRSRAGSVGDASSPDFANLLRDLADLGGESDRAIEQFIAGEQVDLHQVMISVEKTEIAFRLALQLRNKLVDAYREIMRMQV